MHLRRNRGGLRRAGALTAMAATAIGTMLFTAGCSASPTPDISASASDGAAPVTIRVATAVDQYVGYIAIQAAEQLKTFEGSGLDVEVVSATTPTLGQVLAAGQADIALGSPLTEVAARVQGVQQTIVGSAVNEWDYVVIVSQASEFAGATSLDQLKGANFGITGTGSPGDVLLRQWADKLGWSSSDYQESALGNVQALFAGVDSGQVDATLWAVDQGAAAEARGTATYFDLPTPEDNVLQAFSVMDSFASAHPDAVKTFFEYYYKEVESLQKDPQQYIDVIVNDWGTNPEVAQVLAERSLPLMSTDGMISDAQLKGIKNTVPYVTGDGTETPPDIAYTYWKNL